MLEIQTFIRNLTVFRYWQVIIILKYCAGARGAKQTYQWENLGQVGQFATSNVRTCTLCPSVLEETIPLAPVFPPEGQIHSF